MLSSVTRHDVIGGDNIRAPFKRDPVISRHFLHFLEKSGGWSANTSGVFKVAVAGVADTFG